MQLILPILLHCLWWNTINGQSSSTTAFPRNAAGSRLSPPNCRCNEAQTGNAQRSSGTPAQQYCTTTEETFDDICSLVNSLHTNRVLGMRPCGSNQEQPEDGPSSGQNFDVGQDSQFASEQSVGDGSGNRKKRADTISNTLDACLSNGSTITVDAAKLAKHLGDYPSWRRRSAPMAFGQTSLATPVPTTWNRNMGKGLGIRCFGQCPCTFHCPTRDADPGYPTGSRNDASDYSSQSFTLPPWNTENQEGRSVDYGSNVNEYGPAGNNRQRDGDSWMTQRQGASEGNFNSGNSGQNQNAMQYSTGPGTGYQQSATGSRGSFPSGSGSEALSANGFDPRRPRNQNLPFYGTKNAATCRQMPCQQVQPFQIGFSSGESGPRNHLSQANRFGTGAPFDGNSRNSGNARNIQDNQRYGAGAGNFYG